MEADRLPVGYRLYKPVHNVLTRAGNLVVADRHPALVARNRLTGVVFEKALRAEGITSVRSRDGFAIFVSMKDRGAAEILFERSYVPEETRVLLALLQRVSLFVDVGANYGYFSLLGAANGARDLSIIAVEPNPSLAAMIGRSAASNGFSNIEVVSAAAGALKGTVGFAVNEGFSAISQISEEGAGTIDVDVVTVDDLLAQRGDTGRVLIKVDVEGHEAAVLEGSQRALEEGAIVTCEVFSDSVEAVTEQMVSHGYRILRHSGAPVTKDDWRRHKRLDVVCMPPGESLFGNS